MKIRSTVFWPEQEILANQVVDLPDDVARARIEQGLAVEHVEPAPEPESTAPGTEAQ